MIAFLVTNPLGNIKSPSDQFWSVVTFSPLLGILLVGLILQNRNRRAEIDDAGIRWYVGRRLRRFINWTEVKSVEYGGLTTSLGTFRPRTNEFLLLFGQNYKVLLRLNNFTFQSAPDSIHHAVEATVTIARARGIQIVNKDVRF